MSNLPPDDPMTRRVLAWWSVVLKIGSGLLGALIVYSDAYQHPPADTTTSGIGLLLLGYQLVALGQHLLELLAASKDSPQ